MSSPSSIITLGFGVVGSTALAITLGFGIGAASIPNIAPALRTMIISTETRRFRVKYESRRESVQIEDRTHKVK